MLSNTALQVAQAPRPPKGNTESYIAPYFMPPWVMPLTFHIMNGYGSSGVINGIGLDENNDLMLYRKISEADRMLWPSLIGIDEIWIMAEIPSEN